MPPAAGAGEYIERIGRAMAGIREIARQYRDEIMYRIAWVAIWKVGRSWNARAFWLNADSDMIEDEDMQDARDIVAADANAILLRPIFYDLQLPWLIVADLPDIMT